MARLHHVRRKVACPLSSARQPVFREPDEDETFVEVAAIRLSDLVLLLGCQGMPNLVGSLR